MDKFIEVANKKIHIYSYGAGPATVVFLSGSGVPFPQLEYSLLQKELAGAYQVVGIEKLGYGLSDLAVDERTIDTVIHEYRCALHKYGITKPVILAAHSMGFLEALRWEQQYPAEVLGILGIDPATPECYSQFDLQKAINGLVELSENEVLRKAAAMAHVEQLLEEQSISSDEKEKYLTLAFRNFANQNWISEAKQMNNSLKIIEADNPYLQIPILFFISNGEGTSINRDAWLDFAKQFLSRIKNAHYEVFDYPHNLYKFAYKEMAQTAKEFISNYIDVKML